MAPMLVNAITLTGPPRHPQARAMRRRRAEPDGRGQVRKVVSRFKANSMYARPVSGSETHSVKRHLNVDAESYDVQIRRFIPHYDEMITTCVEVPGALAPADAHVLDLGGGTGALSAAVLDGLPPRQRYRSGCRPRTCSAKPVDGWPRSRGSGFLSQRQLSGPAARSGGRGRLLWRCTTSMTFVTKTVAATGRFTTPSLPGGVLLNLDVERNLRSRGLNRARVRPDGPARMGDHGITDAGRRVSTSQPRRRRIATSRWTQSWSALREAGFDQVEPCSRLCGSSAPSRARCARLHRHR